MRRDLLCWLLAAAVVVCALLPSSAIAAEAKVVIDNFVFGPTQLTVKAGTTVTWTNRDDIPHAVASKTPGQFKSRVLDTDQSFSFTFTTPGTYPYFCSLHPHMTATIVVEAPAGSPATQ